MFKNTFWLGIAQFIQVALAAIIGILLARYLGAIDYGKYTFAISFTSLFAVLFDFGFSTYLINEIARDKSKLNSYLGNILSLKILISVIFIILIYILIIFSGKPFDVKILVYVSGLTLIFNSFSILFYAIFRAHEKMELEALFVSLFAVINFICVILAILIKLNLLQILSVSLFVSLLGIITVFAFVQKRVTKIELKKEIPLWRKLLKDITPFVLSGVFINIYFYIAQVILSFMKGNEITGWYGAIYKILLVVTSVIGVYYAVFFPIASRLFKEDRNKLKLLLHVSMRGALILCLPLSFGVALLAKPLVLLIFGNDFSKSASGLQILIWAAVLIFICSAYSNTLLACLQRKIYTIGVALGAIVNIVANLILIPRFSLEGAAAATVLTEIIVLIYMYYNFSKKIMKLNFLIYLLKPLLATIVMGVVIYFLDIKQVNIFYIIFAGIIIYTIALLILKGVKFNELLLAKNILFPKNKIS
ncbi:MAG: flippase [Patescibacteria group bacterium]